MRAITWKGETHYLTEIEVRALKRRLQSKPTVYNEADYAELPGKCSLCEKYKIECARCPLDFASDFCLDIAESVCEFPNWDRWHRSKAHQAAAARRKLVKALDALSRVRRKA